MRTVQTGVCQRARTLDTPPPPTARILDLFSKRRWSLTCLGELMLAMEVLLPGVLRASLGG